MTSIANEQRWTGFALSVRDGLTVRGRHYAAGGGGRRALLCLPGLTRNGRDFHDLAIVLSDPRGHRRDVYTLDSRGRGASDYDRDWKNYSVHVEALDALDFITAAGISDAAILGTSRGGLVAMAMAAMRPAVVGAVILNDIGPVLDRSGLARIVAYVGQAPLPGSWPEAGRHILAMNRDQFPTLTDADAEAVARQIFNEIDGRPAPAYDPALARALALPDGPLPEAWDQFSALYRVPVLAIRGANSDILSAATLAEMQRRHPQLIAHTVPNEGHTPLLRDRATQGAIHEFLLRTDGYRTG